LSSLSRIHDTADTALSVKSLQNQISELEADRSRVTQTLEARKDTAHQAELAARKREEELSRELASKVSIVLPFQVASTDKGSQTSETESLKTRLRKYSDYDEIKRELDIMKVGVVFMTPIVSKSLAVR